MEFTLGIKSSGAAFEEPLPEIARILRLVADQVESGNECANIQDINGNTVGTFELLEEELA